jgi:uncharacterized membrane protein YedE/YeeE
MNLRLTALICGAAFGFVLSWSRLTDPDVIASMLLLREMHVFLIMGSAVFTAAVGVRLLAQSRAFITGEVIAWTTRRVERRHIIGSMLFGAGWSVARTCPGPVAAMIGEGRVLGFVVAAGILAGVALQPYVVRRRWAADVIGTQMPTATAR